MAHVNNCAERSVSGLRWLFERGPSASVVRTETARLNTSRGNTVRTITERLDAITFVHGKVRSIQRLCKPKPAPPRTAFCHICMDDDPISENFRIAGCSHTYCRETMRTYILGRIDEQDVTPKCPHPECTATISDPEITSVLADDEQRRYYDASIMKAVNDTPTLHKCLQEGCRGVGALPLRTAKFPCPLCNVECCVQCNTRKWHVGLTCAQVRQRGLDSQLHPDQLRSMYGGKAVYQCGSCGFGPIEHMNCSNLKMHHHEAVGKSRINNACQRCGWFAENISARPRWNGEMPATARV